MIDVKNFNRVQINYNVRKGKDGVVLDKSTLISIRTDDPTEAFDLYKKIQKKLNGELSEASQEVATTKQTQEGSCPKCDSNMVKRVAKKGESAGNEFLGCVNYPECKETLPILPF